MQDNFLDDEIHDECGVFGIYAPGEDVASISYLALYGIQHRGQESAGIAVFDGDVFKVHKATGFATEVFDGYDFSKLKGDIAIAHARYADSADDRLVNAQPMAFYHSWGRTAIASNSSIINKKELRMKFKQQGSVFQTTSDCEIFAHLISHYAQAGLEDALVKMMFDAKGAYSTLFMVKDKLIGVRDPHGIRPLCIGKLGEHYVLSSESCAFSVIGAKYIRDVEPGEVVSIDKDGLHSYKYVNKKPAFCIFEYVYIARPDSIINNHCVATVRRNMGKALARRYPIDADVVVAVPDSGVSCALGYAEESGIPYTLGLLKNRYIARTFIQPTQTMREKSVQLKLSPVEEELRGKRVVLVDDSIVRGTTSKKIVAMVREAGATEVHLVISSPQVLFGCNYGVDTKNKDLIARTCDQDVERMAKEIGVDGLYFLSQEDMLEATGQDPENFCCACFDGKYLWDEEVVESEKLEVKSLQK